MDRWACIDVPALPLQLLLKERPEWRAHPAVVVAADRPQAPILWANERAWRERIRPGMRYAAALALVRNLRAGTVSDGRIDAGIDAVAARLREKSPEVEPFRAEPGVFWCNAAGLGSLFGSLERWAEAVHADLGRAAFHAAVVVGFTRFGTYAVARALARPGVRVFETPAEEREVALEVPLDRLAADPGRLKGLDRLGVRTAGELLALPPRGLRERFGEDAYRLHRLASGDVWVPLEPEFPDEAPQERLVLDFGEDDRARLLFRVKGMLHSLLDVLASRGQALVELRVRLVLERADPPAGSIRPASPTLDAVQIADLVRLWLEARELASPAVEIELAAIGSPATPIQLRLLREGPRRDLEAGARALARLRAELGEDAVVRAELRPGHLPEASFAWEPIDRLSPPRPDPAASLSLIRRIHARPQALPSRGRREPDGWLVRGIGDGPVVKTTGPYVLSGGWWKREVHRDYYFLETRQGDLLWVYHDRRRRRWFLHGEVE